MTSPEFIPLGSLLSRGRSAGTPVAVGPQGPKSWEDLIHGVSAWKAAYAARQEPSFALHHEDSWTFSCALLGAWAAGKRVSVPGDGLPATLSRLGLPQIGAAPAVPAAMPGWPRRAAGEPVLTIFTSGSTGTPASFDKSFEQLGAELEALESAFGGVMGPAAVLSTVSHLHIYGLLFKILWPLCAGRVIHLPRLFYPEEILAATNQYDRAALVASPAHLGLLPESQGWAAVAHRWSAVFSSGGPLPSAAAQKTLAIFGRAPFEIFGSSETGGIAWRQRAAEGSPWRSFPNVELKIDDETGTLCVRSPHLPDRDWFSTADKARWTDDGFELLGRMDRIVKVGENRVSLTAVEDALLGCGLVAQARVLPVEAAAARLGAVVVPSAEGSTLDAPTLQKRLREALAERVEAVAIPKRWRFASQLPINASGKTTQEALRALFEARPRLPKRLWLERKDPGRARIGLRLDKELACFEGHFPAAAILPGVVQIDWAIQYARELLALDGDFRKIEALKFHRILEPGDEPELKLEFDAGAGRLKFSYETARGIHSSGAVYFKKRFPV